jgi:hypothetical protein
MVHGHDPPKGGQDTGVGTLAPDTQATGSLIRTRRSKRAHAKKRLSATPVSCMT